MRRISGGSGNRGVVIGLMYGGLLKNDLDTPYEVHYGFDTVANGYAREIVLEPGECARRLIKGSPYDFAEWAVGNRDEFPEEMNVILVSQCEKWR